MAVQIKIIWRVLWEQLSYLLLYLLWYILPQEALSAIKKPENAAADAQAAAEAAPATRHKISRKNSGVSNFVSVQTKFK